MAAHCWMDGLVTCGLAACTLQSARAQCSEMSMGKLYLSLPFVKEQGLLGGVKTRAVK